MPSPTSYKVLACSFKKNIDVQTPEGQKTFAVYEMQLDDGRGPLNAEWKTKVGGAGPEVGSTVEGTTELTEYGWKFKRSPRSRSEAPRSPSNGKSKGEPYRKHPAEVAAVQRAHAQEMAIRHMHLLQLRGELDKKTPEERQELMVKVIDWFEADVNKAMELAELPPAEIQLRDQASRLADAGEKAIASVHRGAMENTGVLQDRSEAPQGHVEAPERPSVEQGQEETREQMEDRVRAEVLMANTKLKDMDHV